MKDTVTLKILRSAYIETNSDVALIQLDTMEHQEGQPVMIQYYDDNSKVKTITAIGTRNGVGKDCYSIVSTSDEFIINGVEEILPDVSQLVNGAIYISKYEGQWSLVYIWGNEIKRVEPLDPTKNQIFKELSTGYKWYWTGEHFHREDDFLNTNEVSSRFEELRLERKLNCSFVRGNLHLSGDKLTEPVLYIQITEGNRDITSNFDFNIVSTVHGQETIKDIKEVNYITLYKTIDATAIYTVTAISRIDRETLSTDCEIKFLPYTLYIKSKVSDKDTILSKTDFSQVLWGGDSDLSLVFNDLDLEYTVIFIPKEIGIPNQILDNNSLDYIDDYVITEVVYSENNYIMLTKMDAISMRSFKQILKYE